MLDWWHNFKEKVETNKKTVLQKNDFPPSWILIFFRKSDPLIRKRLKIEIRNQSLCKICKARIEAVKSLI